MSARSPPHSHCLILTQWRRVRKTSGAAGPARQSQRPGFVTVCFVYVHCLPTRLERQSSLRSFFALPAPPTQWSGHLSKRPASRYVLGEGELASLLVLTPSSTVTTIAEFHILS
ncbi:hypothetical protein BaRGS_00036409 [Batillaria attramentaria]|uniref:Uncharacterized protein n=1 Tax=Batillaria attramentaria TaxID=370345 RepID=A0ABD0JBJ9_9CAEN